MEIAATAAMRAAILRSRDIITPKRLEVLRHVYEYRKEHGMSPSVRKLAEIRGTTFPAVHRIIQRLAEDGYLESNSIHRGIVLTEKAKRLLDHRCPHCAGLLG